MFAGQEMESSVALGILSLFVSVLNTTGSYFGWAKRAEGHRISAIQYGKLFRFLSIELSLPREERMSPHDLLKLTKENYDRLQEISPLVPPELIKEFASRFKKYEDKVALPDELNGLSSIRVHTNPIFRSESFTQKTPKNPNAELPAREDLRIAVPSDRPSLHRVNHSPPIGTNGES
jgi:hypothetical protein